MSDGEGVTTTALTAIIDVLTPLNSDDRHRIVNAAMVFLGETAPKKQTAIEDDDDGGGEGYPAHAAKWMKQNGVTAAELEYVFHFKADGTFEILDVPGKTQREKTLNTYVLTGLGKFLSANDRNFDDTTARQFCQSIGCYDQANHASTIKEKGSDFSGEKSKGYTLTTVGMKRGAILIKEFAGAAQ